MAKGQLRSLPGKFRPLLTLILLLAFSFVSYGQTYNPSLHVVVNDAVSPAQATPLDSRSMYYDPVNFLYRSYQSQNEVLSYLNLQKYRYGNFIIVIDSGGTLQSNGIYINGTNTFWMFKDSTTNGGLVKLNLFGATAGCSGCLLAANNLSDLGNLTTALTNLNLNNVNNTSDATKNAAVATLTNKTISGLSNTFSNIPNSALVNNSIGLSFTSNPGADISVTTTPAALGTTLIANFPNASSTQRGPLKASDWLFFHGKLDSVHVSNDSLYNCVNGTCTFNSLISGGGGSGTVQNVTVNNLTPLFTSNVTTPTTTPVVTFTLSNAAQYTVFGDSAGSSGTPFYYKPNAALLNTWFGGTLQGALTLTTTGSSGAATLIGNTLNIPVYSSGSGGNPNSNIGSGYRWAVPNTNNIKTVFGSLIIIDSTTNTNALTFTADTSSGAAKLATQGFVTRSYQPIGNYITATTGDVVATGPGSVAATIQPNAVTTSKINNNAVTLAKMATNTVNTLLGYDGSGNASDITISVSPTTGAASLSGGVLSLPQYNLQGVITNGPSLTTNNSVNNGGEIFTWINAGTGLWKWSGLQQDTTNTVGPYVAGPDSSQRMIPWAKFAVKLSPYLPTYNIYPVQGLSPIGTHNDSIALGGVAGAFFQADTIVTAGFPFFITGLPNKNPTGTDSNLIITAAGQVYKAVLSSGSGTVTSVAETVPSALLTISGSPITTSGTLALGLATQSANTAFGNFTGSTATPTFGKIPLAALATNTANTLIGFDGSGNPVDITAGSNITISGGTISASSSGITNLATGFGLLGGPITSTGTILADSTALATVYQDGLKIVKPNFLGNLYVKNTWANTSDFTLVGSPTFAASGGKLTLSGGSQNPSEVVGTTNTAPNQAIEITAYGGTMLEKYVVVDTFVVNTAGNGFGIGTYSISAGGVSHAIGRFNPNSGLVSLLLGNSFTTAAISLTAMATPSSGDSVVVMLERFENKISVTARNIHTKSAAVSCSYVWDQSSPSNILTPNTSYFGIVNFGGSYTINSMAITSNEAVGANVLFGGDSKLAGYSTSWDMRLGSLWNRTFPGTVVSAGEGDRTADFLNHLPEIIALKPKTVILCIGRNDLAGGVSTATWQANLDTIAVRLTRAGIPYYSYDAFYETSISQTNLIAFIDSGFLFGGHSPSFEIKTYDAGNFSGSVAPDNVHPTYLANEKYFDVTRGVFLITNNGKFLNDRFPIRSVTPSYDNMWVYGTINMLTKTTNGLGPYVPTITNNGDILMNAGNAIAASYGAGNQQNRIVVSNAGTAALELRTYTGGLPGNAIINMYTANNSTGTQNLNFSMTEGGWLYLGTASTSLTATTNRGDLILGANGAIRSGTLNDGKHESAIVLDSTNDGSMRFRIYDSAASYLFYQSLIGQTAGSQTLTMALNGYGNLLLNTTTGHSSIFTVNGGIWQNKDSAITSTAGSVVPLGIDTATGRYVKDYNLGGSTPTLQQVLTAGSTLTTNNTIALGSNTLSITSGNIGLGASATTTSALTVGLASYNSSYGTGLVTSAGTSNDPVTSASGTVATMSANRFQVPTFTATNSGVTYTNAATVYIDGPPTAGSNVTETNKFPLYVAGTSPSYFAGPIVPLHIGGNSSALSSTSLGTNVSSITVSGNDNHFKLTVVTSGAVTGTFGTINFGNAWSSTPIVVISSADVTTGSAIATTVGGYIAINGISTTQASLVGNITASGTYVFNVIAGN
jgi:hypothetical protein